MKILKSHSSNFNELLFENRNKNYGAYLIRKEYDESLLTSFAIAMLALLLLAGVFVVLHKNNPQSMIPSAKKYVEQIKIEIDLSYLKQQKKVSEVLEKISEPTKTTVAKANVLVLIKNDALVIENKKREDDALLNSNLNALTKNDKTIAIPGTGLGKDKKEDGLGLGTIEVTKNLAELEIAPEFPGGIDKLMEFLSKNVNYPIPAKENGITGTVYVSFMVDKFGKVKEVKIKRGIFDACDEEVMRVVKLFPDWKPGVYQGQSVSVIFNLPVTFDLRN